MLVRSIHMAALLATLAAPRVAHGQGRPGKDAAAPPPMAGPEEAASPARAAAAPAPGTAGAEAPADPPANRLMLRKGVLFGQGVFGVGVSKGAGGDPISFGPDLWYGASDDLMFGVVHSLWGLTGFWSGAALGSGGPSLCLAGDSCGRAYGTGALVGQYALAAGEGLGLGLIGGVYLDVVDPARVGGVVGLDGLYSFGAGLGLQVTTILHAGINERGDPPEGAGNVEYLHAPVSLTYGLTPTLRAGVQSGVRGPLSGFADGYAIPLALSARLAIDERVTLAGAFMLERVAGFAGPGPTDLRSVSLVVSFVAGDEDDEARRLETRLAAHEARIDELERRIAVAEVPEVVEPAATTSPGEGGASDADALWAEAQAARDAGDDVGAEGIYGRFVHRFPEDERADDAQYQRGELLVRSKALDEAVPEFVKVHERYPTSPLAARALLRAAEQAEALGRCGDARDHYARLRKAFPRSPEAKRSRARDAALRRFARDKTRCKR